VFWLKGIGAPCHCRKTKQKRSCRPIWPGRKNGLGWDLLIGEGLNGFLRPVEEFANGPTAFDLDGDDGR